MKATPLGGATVSGNERSRTGQTQQHIEEGGRRRRQGAIVGRDHQEPPAHVQALDLQDFDVGRFLHRQEADHRKADILLDQAPHAPRAAQRHDDLRVHVKPLEFRIDDRADGGTFLEQYHLLLVQVHGQEAFAHGLQRSMHGGQRVARARDDRERVDDFAVDHETREAFVVAPRRRRVARDHAHVYGPVAHGFDDGA